MSLLVTHVPKYSVEPGPPASRNTHALPQTIQGHKHFPIFPQKNLPCPHLTEKLNLSGKDSSAQITQHCWCGRNRPLCICQEASEVLGFPLAAEYASDATEGFLDSCFISVIPARICRHLIPNQLHTARAMQGYT